MEKVPFRVNFPRWISCHVCCDIGKYPNIGVSYQTTPKSSMFRRNFPEINHPAMGLPPILGNLHIQQLNPFTKPLEPRPGRAQNGPRPRLWCLFPHLRCCEFPVPSFETRGTRPVPVPDTKKIVSTDEITANWSNHGGFQLVIAGGTQSWMVYIYVDMQKSEKKEKH